MAAYHLRKCPRSVNHYMETCRKTGLILLIPIQDEGCIELVPDPVEGLSVTWDRGFGT
jgi:hypothetical protein